MPYQNIWQLFFFFEMFWFCSLASLFPGSFLSFVFALLYCSILIPFLALSLKCDAFSCKEALGGSVSKVHGGNLRQLLRTGPLALIRSKRVKPTQLYFLWCTMQSIYFQLLTVCWIFGVLLLQISPTPTWFPLLFPSQTLLTTDLGTIDGWFFHTSILFWGRYLIT